MIASHEEKEILTRELFDVIAPSIDRLRNSNDKIDFICNSMLDIAIYDKVLFNITGDQKHQDRAQERMVKGLHEIFNMPFRLHHPGGHIGTIWMSELIDQNIIDLDNRTKMFQIIKQHIIENYTSVSAEYVLGFSGIGMAFQRFVGDPEVDESLYLIRKRILDTARWDKDGCYWLGKNAFDEVLGVVLGYSHGVYAIIDFLATEGLRGLGGEPLRRTLESACDWLYKKLSSSICPATPDVIEIDDRTGEEKICGVEYKQIYWCWGLIGLIIPFMKAKKLLGVSRWDDFIDRLIMESLPDDPSESAVLCSGMCHGYLGNVTIFLKAYELFSEKKALHGASLWMNRFIERIKGFGPQISIPREAAVFKYGWDRHNPYKNYWEQTVAWNTDDSAHVGYFMGLSGIASAVGMLISDRTNQWGIEGIMIS